MRANTVRRYIEMDKAEAKRSIEFIDGLLDYCGGIPHLQRQLESERERLQNELEQSNPQSLEKKSA